MKLTSNEARAILENHRGKTNLNNDIVCTAGGVQNPNDKPFIAEFIKMHKYTIEEKLINLCDLMCPQAGRVFTIDKRL